MDLAKKIESKSAIVAVCGLGYVGLPLLAAFHHAGFPYTRLRRRSAENPVAPARRELSQTPGQFARQRYASWRPLRRHQRSLAPVGGRCHHQLRPHAAGQASGAGPELRREDRRRHRHDAAARDNWSCSNPPPIPAPRARSCCRAWTCSGLKCGNDFFLAYSPEREDPGRKDSQHADHPQAGRRHRSRTAARSPPRSIARRSSR